MKFRTVSLNLVVYAMALCAIAVFIPASWAKGISPISGETATNLTKQCDEKGIYKKHNVLCVNSSLNENNINGLLGLMGEVDNVVISSSGGKAPVFRTFARRLDAEDFNTIIHRICYSSCTNYLLPSISNIYVHSDTKFVAHGWAGLNRLNRYLDYCAVASTHQNKPLRCYWKYLSGIADEFYFQLKYPRSKILKKAYFDSIYRYFGRRKDDCEGITPKKCEFRIYPDKAQLLQINPDIKFFGKKRAVKASYYDCNAAVGLVYSDLHHCFKPEWIIENAKKVCIIGEQQGTELKGVDCDYIKALKLYDEE